MQEHFHTHLSRFNDTDRLRPLDQDIRTKESDSRNGVKKFIIITTPENVEY